jgi:hypothetical protein
MTDTVRGWLDTPIRTLSAHGSGPREGSYRRRRSEGGVLVVTLGDRVTLPQHRDDEAQTDPRIGPR